MTLSNGHDNKFLGYSSFKFIIKLKFIKPLLFSFISFSLISLERLLLILLLILVLVLVLLSILMRDISISLCDNPIKSVI